MCPKICQHQDILYDYTVELTGVRNKSDKYTTTTTTINADKCLLSGVLRSNCYFGLGLRLGLVLGVSVRDRTPMFATAPIESYKGRGDSQITNNKQLIRKCQQLNY